MSKHVQACCKMLVVRLLFDKPTEKHRLRTSNVSIVHLCVQSKDPHKVWRPVERVLSMVVTSC
jgi:hypothetical protein